MSVRENECVQENERERGSVCGYKSVCERVCKKKMRMSACVCVFV